MTPTERAAVAEAIAALDWAKDFADSHTRESDNYQATTWLTKDGMRRYLTIGDIRRAYAALASLRAVAPAPAECRHCKDDPANCDFDICQFRHPSAPADQSDAGRDGVAGDTEAEDLLRWAAQLLSDAMEADWSSTGWCIDAHIVDEKITAFLGRVLASAPSETVGRGEDLAERFERALGTNHKMLHGPLATLCWDNRITFIAALRSALSIADRDAIRDTLQQADRYIHQMGIPDQWDRHIMAKLTAALALIGEG